MEKAVDRQSGSVLERPEVAHLLKAAAAALALLVFLSWSGRVALSPGLRWLLTVGTLVALVLGWKAFREGLAAVQSTILMAVIYGVGVGSAALVAWIARRDLLDLRRRKISLWRRRARLSPEELARNIERQF